MTEQKVAVVAVGGNSLIKDKDRKTINDQYDAAAESMRHIAGMIEHGWEVVITHGNGPQVGFILRRSELSKHELHEVPLDYCGADSQGAIGYMFQQSLCNEFAQRSIDKQAATVVTQVEVDRNDPAFQSPSKPIGSFMDESMANQRKEAEGWVVVEDAGRGWRRVVPSPLPVRILQQDAIVSLIESGFVVIAVGGGGIPVVQDGAGNLTGVEAVIDKDFASALLASQIGADMFLISTAVPQIAINYNQPDQTWIDKMTLAEAKAYMEQGHFAKGSMEPKVQAIINYLEAGGKEAMVTDPDNIERALAGETGTRIVP
ncbi:MAG: carbamate kinase [Anaerolineales bacterium]